MARASGAQAGRRGLASQTSPPQTPKPPQTVGAAAARIPLPGYRPPLVSGALAEERTTGGATAADPAAPFTSAPHTPTREVTEPKSPQPQPQTTRNRNPEPRTRKPANPQTPQPLRQFLCREFALKICCRGGSAQDKPNCSKGVPQRDGPPPWRSCEAGRTCPEPAIYEAAGEAADQAAADEAADEAADQAAADEAADELAADELPDEAAADEANVDKPAAGEPAIFCSVLDWHDEDPTVLGRGDGAIKAAPSKLWHYQRRGTCRDLQLHRRGAAEMVLLVSTGDLQLNRLKGPRAKARRAGYLGALANGTLLA
jgi:hypothetical protein